MNESKKTIKAILNNKFEADFTLQFIMNKEEKLGGILTVPFVDYVDDKTPFLSSRIINIRGLELQCIDNLYFKNNILSIPVQGYPYPVEMCDILLKVVPPNIYNQFLSNTFKIDMRADQKIYSKFINAEKQNTEIKKFIAELDERKYPYFNMNEVHYAKQIKDVPNDCSLGNPLYITMEKNNIVPEPNKYFIIKIQNTLNGDKAYYSTQNICEAKKMYDDINTFYDFEKIRKEFSESYFNNKNKKNIIPKTHTNKANKQKQMDTGR